MDTLALLARLPLLGVSSANNSSTCSFEAPYSDHIARTSDSY
ncbi:hypothetical protein KPSA3_07522 [Pseudomonas syringae pv. actinidiae]|uniref:Uncharacterized protein n=1 Tax=Pseudomonas syringae pv. actinidiae TaxID=103796 RepID=A0AAN4QD62_PSESF|nr:hypothetical protein KPSA3_07522 [Pseudomonas syringae pv. actinidiae]